MLEDAHFRIDELARGHAALEGKLGEHEHAASGMVAAVMAIVDQRIEAAGKALLEHVRAELDRYKTEDKAEDRKMIADAISKALDREETVEKHGTVKTADGTHEMHVVETRKRKT
jgi:Tfp pilus assembly major pilin PilA